MGVVAGEQYREHTILRGRSSRASLSEPVRACLCPLICTTMAEFNSPVDSSFVLVGTDQSQVLPLSRPPTVTSDTTFPSSISTPTSPIDSNVSSVGTLEVPNHSFPLLFI